MDGSADCEDGVTIRRMIVSWDHIGSLLLARETGQTQRVAAQEMVEGVPQMAENLLPVVVPRVVVLPMELLLLRPVALPLSHPRFIDSAILGQELEEQAGIDAEAWWLAWQMDRLDEGCSGVVFAMPLLMQQRLASDPLWSQSTTITTDGWVRLQSWLSGEVTQNDAVVAVVDADVDGVFFGCWRGGCWLGMRRLNGSGSEQEDGCCAVMVAQMMRSLQAMGWRDGPIVGRMDSDLYAALIDSVGVDGVVWEGQIDESLPDRLDANVEAARGGEVSLDFRHGRWAAASEGLGDWRLWRRSAALMALLCLLWYGQQQMAMHSLEQQSAVVEEGIAQAFHRGLPDQAVMLDPLGQLQVAAQGIGIGVDRQQLLRQMAVVASVRKQVQWELRELRLQDGVVRLRGSVSDLKSLNKVHDLLQKRVGHKVTIEDTDLRKNSVGFRMRWS